MKKIKLLTLLLITLSNCAFAIEWVTLTSPLDKTVELDTDSITELKGYYFYNIKVPNNPNILTVQSEKTKPFSKVIKLTPINSYTGDYSNIAAGAVKNLEPVTYVSIANTCYKRVKRIMQIKEAYSTIDTTDSN